MHSVAAPMRRVNTRVALLRCLIICLLVSGCTIDPDSIRIPVRLCAIEGSPEAMGLQPGDVNEDFSGSLFERVKDAGRIWSSQANIDFDPGISFVVVADPFPEGQLGDIDEYHHPFEPMSAAEACAAAWQKHDSEQKGLIVVNARAFVLSGLTFGVVNPVDGTLQVNGSRGDDLCGHPRHLTVADVAQTSWAVVSDEALLPGYEDPAAILAHEIGHMLMLDHGNGLDDNHDGLEPPDEGPRRFDGYCDPLRFEGDSPAEDPPFTGCEDSSLMHGVSSPGCTTIRPLQSEQAREVARLIPGVSVGGSSSTTTDASLSGL